MALCNIDSFASANLQVIANSRRNWRYKMMNDGPHNFKMFWHPSIVCVCYKTISTSKTTERHYGIPIWHSTERVRWQLSHVDRERFRLRYPLTRTWVKIWSKGETPPCQPPSKWCEMFSVSKQYKRDFPRALKRKMQRFVISPVDEWSFVTAGVDDWIGN